MEKSNVLKFISSGNKKNVNYNKKISTNVRKKIL